MIHACTCDLHSEVANAKCNAAKWHGKHTDWKKIVSKDFCIQSCKDTEMDYAQSSWQSKL